MRMSRGRVWREASPCPTESPQTCESKQPMEFTVVRRLLRDSDTSVPAGTPAPPVPSGRSVVLYRTVDSVVYDNTPAGESGCGAYWSLTLPAGAGA